MAEALHEGAGAILFDIGDHEQLAHAISLVRSDYEAALARAQHAAATARHEFTVHGTSGATL